MTHSLDGKEIILGVTGSIAVYKAVEILRELTGRGASVTVVMTESAQRFVSPLTFETLSRRPILTDLFALDYDKQIGHVATGGRADLYLIAPATANTIAKLAHGIADDFLTNLYLSCTCPVLLAPAMDREMYAHPTVQENLTRLKARGVHVLETEYGELASGLIGRGRLADLLTICGEVEGLLTHQEDLQGETVLVTAGPTQEPLDPVRFLSNRSSGRMGFAIAQAARDRGAHVLLVSGPTSLPTPPGVTRTDVTTAEEMLHAVLGQLDATTILIMAAAVADYRPSTHAPKKMKKQESLTVELLRNPDILAEAGRQKESRILVGFAAETEDLVSNAREKLQKKHLDLIVANDIRVGFGGETTRVTILDRQGQVEELPELSKREVAHQILDRVVAVRRGD
ncbi:MAG: bifunctional phosphopantothenoylcysteine decarboxylase/phosphopantothenate--cysteine ligase CoaBC [candidate division NC10 bacterium]|nr:bifunctional phosphopantothenoylcysteine decarboxylase/phosphopantothenate--cysteine ligase CoaBC [candidate division NC10 bacterium]